MLEPVPHPAMKLVRRLLLVVLLITTSGCMRWTRMRTPAPAPDAPLRFSTIRVTPSQGSPVVLSAVEVTVDSVVGRRVTPPGIRERMAVHRGDVLVLQRRTVDFLRTAMGAAVAGAVAVLGLAAHITP
ncbi:MAG TPA: hypothetical protein VF006_25390 [Longimicrobium sp.]